MPTSATRQLGNSATISAKCSEDGQILNITIIINFLSLFISQLVQAWFLTAAASAHPKVQNEASTRRAALRKTRR
jgi:hypothetical protein